MYIQHCKKIDNFNVKNTKRCCAKEIFVEAYLVEKGDEPSSAHSKKIQVKSLWKDNFTLFLKVCTNSIVIFERAIRLLRFKTQINKKVH